MIFLIIMKWKMIYNVHVKYSDDIDLYFYNNNYAIY